MSRHRNVGGWVAETYDEDDHDDAYYGAGEAETLPIDAYVMAKFYDEDQWYPGTIIDYSEYGYMVLFEGYEEDGAQDTDPHDVELLKLPGEDESSSAAIDLESFNDLAAEVASVLEGEVTDSDIRAALEASNFKLEAATASLLDWVAAGKPSGTFAKKAAKKKPQTAGGQTATPQKASGGGGGSGAQGGNTGGKQNSGAKVPKAAAGKEKQAAKQKEAAKAKAAPKAGDADCSAGVPDPGGGGSAGAWTVTREMDSLGLGGDSGAAGGLSESVDSEVWVLL